MLRPAILIGCGGSGQKAIRYVREAVERRLRHAGWQRDLPSGWVFLGLDTLNQQEDPSEIPLLPQSDYHSLSPHFHTYQQLEQAVLARHRPADDSTYRELIGWRPRSSEVRVPLKDGAGATRAVGRFAGIQSLRHVLERPIARAFEAVEQASGDLAEVSELLRVPIAAGGDDPTPLVVVCASMAGGTGAGVALDVVEIIRNSHQYGQFPSLVLFTPDIFDDPKYDGMRRSMAGNSLGMICETMNVYWDTVQDALPLWAGSRNLPGRGPHATFLVGRRSLHGGDLGDAAAVYRSVGESLANWVTNRTVQERVHAFVTTNWSDRATNHGGYPFGQEHQTGVVSSFGAATISVGRDRFEQWANDLLARETLEALVRGHLREEHVRPGGDRQSEKALVGHLGRLAAPHLTFGDSASSLVQAPSPSAEHRGARTVRSAFANDEDVRDERRSIETAFRNEFSPIHEGTGAEWSNWLRRAARTRRDESLARAHAFNATPWGTNMVMATCEAISALVARTSLWVAKSAVDVAIGSLNKEVEMLRREAGEQQSESDASLSEALTRLEHEGRRLTGDSEPVTQAMDLLARGIARRWLAERLDMAAASLEATAHRVFHPASDRLRQAIAIASDALADAAVETWPRDGAGVPPAYRPSSVEYPLETHESWPALLNDLCSEAVSERTAALTPVNAARFVLIAGDDHTPPLMRPAHDTWSPTHSSVANFQCDVNVEAIASRVQSWTQRPASRFARVVKEGLGAYLAERDPVTERARPDHTERLARFRTSLEDAMRQSAPLMRIDHGVHSKIYADGTTASDVGLELICAPFPLPDEHPAHELAEQIVGAENFGVANDDASSVLISSFLQRPVHPITVASVTDPVAEAVMGTNSNRAEMQAAFWLWRRTRRLDQFVPLPRDSRYAMIRGFATARLCGYITTDSSRPILISSESGPLEFPHPMLTQVEPDDVLAGLLESIALGFAFVQRDKEAAFAAYAQLHRLGQSMNSLHSDAQKWLETGRSPLAAVDQPRAAGADTAERIASARTYLTANIKRLEQIDSEPLKGHGSEAKPRDGRVHGTIPTLEIVDESLLCYRDVLSALDRFDEAPIV
ncbi:tubulin-like doman-containing protein [Candidatus Poriferisodalis sp.]|uniref:tubulin-like doman-containing protein n=1 Tax=Candidatus Poriferisodalis sp. TaxID=3101277 RepID=UPI003B0253E6